MTYLHPFFFFMHLDLDFVREVKLFTRDALPFCLVSRRALTVRSVDVFLHFFLSLSFDIFYRERAPTTGTSVLGGQGRSDAWTQADQHHRVFARIGRHRDGN